MVTWKEFKDEVERQGIKDSTAIDYIDWDGQEDIVADFCDENKFASIT